MDKKVDYVCIDNTVSSTTSCFNGTPFYIIEISAVDGTEVKDLLWNGGIGTYVKASFETDAQVDDKLNDALRIDAQS